MSGQFIITDATGISAARPPDHRSPINYYAMKMELLSRTINVGRSARLCFLGTALALLTVGCNNDVGPNSRKGIFDPVASSHGLPWAKSNAATNGAMYITASTSVGRPDVAYLGGGVVYASTAQTPPPLDGGQMTISGATAHFDPQAGYVTMGTAVFGGVGAWGLAGNSAKSVQAFTESMYMPAVVHLSAPAAASVLSKTNNLTVRWNADPGNDTVYIGFRYNGDASNFVDSTMSASYEYSRGYLAPDNGSYTIPASALSGLPTGGYMELWVARGNAKIGGPQNAKYSLYGYALATGLYKITN
jgi:hypothetical protein